MRVAGRGRKQQGGRDGERGLLHLKILNSYIYINHNYIHLNFLLESKVSIKFYDFLFYGI